MLTVIITVTGASGHLGANLIRILLQHGHRVRAIIHRHTTGINGLSVAQLHADILNSDSLKEAFIGSDIVIHLAAKISIVPWDRKQIEATNIDGVRNVVSACISTGVKRLIHISSIHAYEQNPRSQALDENRSLINLGRGMTYDFTKAKGEQIIHEGVKTGLDAVIVVPTGIVGPYDFEPSLFGSGLLTFARRNAPLTITGGFDWVDVRDVADAILRVAEVAPPGEKYLLSGHWVSLSDVARQVCQIMGKKPPSFSFPRWGAFCIAPAVTAFNRAVGRRPLFTTAAVKALGGNKIISHAKASRTFGYKPRPFTDTLTDTLAWFEQNGYIKKKTVDVS
jgi:dihydroflavonol-4-reductase